MAQEGNVWGEQFGIVRPRGAYPSPPREPTARMLRQGRSILGIQRAFLASSEL